MQPDKTLSVDSRDKDLPFSVVCRIQDLTDSRDRWHDRYFELSAKYDELRAENEALAAFIEDLRSGSGA